MEQANDVQEMLGRSYGLPDDIDEADLEAGTIIFNLYCVSNPLIPLLQIELDALGDDMAMAEDGAEPSYLDESEPSRLPELGGSDVDEFGIPREKQKLAA